MMRRWLGGGSRRREIDGAAVTAFGEKQTLLIFSMTLIEPYIAA